MLTDSAKVLPPGTAVGGFKVLKLLGKGAWGHVYLAEQRSLKRDVALKVFFAELTPDEETIEEFVRETRLTASLDHPNIVTAYDAGEDTGVCYLAMTYIEGEDMAQYLDGKGIVEETKALEIVAKVADALGYGWRKNNLIHRDVKPANIMLDHRGEPVLLDLGIAKSLSADAQRTIGSGYIVGTPDYMSPEQARGQADLDQRADIYALGATLYHFVTGQAPFAGESYMEIIQKQLSEPLVPPIEINPKLSQATNQLICQMLEKSPADRPADWEIVCQQVAKVKKEGKKKPEQKKPAKKIRRKPVAEVPAEAEEEHEQAPPPTSAGVPMLPVVILLVGVIGVMLWASGIIGPKPVVIDPDQPPPPKRPTQAEVQAAAKAALDEQRAEFNEILAFAANNSPDYKEILNRLATLDGAVKDTTLKGEIKAQTSAVSEALNRRLKSIMKALDKKAEPFAESEEFGRAAEVYETYDDVLAAELKKELDSRAARYRKEEQRVATREERAAEWEARLANKWGDAETQISTVRNDELLNLQPKKFNGFLEEAIAVLSINRDIADSLRDQLGNPFSVVSASGASDDVVVLREVGEDTFVGEKEIEYLGKVHITYAIADLPTERKLAQFEEPKTPADHVVRGVLLISADKLKQAREQFEAAGESSRLAQAFTAAIANK
jgi:serine/threonine protein kinase